MRKRSLNGHSVCSAATDRVVHEKELQQQSLYYNVFDVVGLPIIYLSYPDFICRGLNRNALALSEAIQGTPWKRAKPGHHHEKEMFLSNCTHTLI